MQMSVRWLHWSALCLCILNRKLSFLWKLANLQCKSISSDIFNLLKDQEPGPLIVQQSHLLEQDYTQMPYLTS